LNGEDMRKKEGNNSFIVSPKLLFFKLLFPIYVGEKKLSLSVVINFPFSLFLSKSNKIHPKLELSFYTL